MLQPPGFFINSGAGKLPAVATVVCSPERDCLTYVATPRNEWISGVAYDSGTWVTSVAVQVILSPSVYAIIKSTDGGLDVSARAGRFYLSGGSTAAINDNFAFSTNAGTSWTPKRTDSGDYAAPMVKHTRTLFLSNSVLLTTRSLNYPLSVSRDSGLTFASTAYFDAAKLEQQHRRSRGLATARCTSPPMTW